METDHPSTRAVNSGSGNRDFTHMYNAHLTDNNNKPIRRGFELYECYLVIIIIP